MTIATTALSRLFKHITNQCYSELWPQWPKIKHIHKQASKQTNTQINSHLPSVSFELFVKNANAKLPSHSTNDNGMDKPHNKTGKIM